MKRRPEHPHRPFRPVQRELEARASKIPAGFRRRRWVAVLLLCGVVVGGVAGVTDQASRTIPGGPQPVAAGRTIPGGPQPVAAARTPEAVPGKRAIQHACRFWGIVGHGYDSALIPDQLRESSGRTLKELGAANADGWGFAVFPSEPLRSTWPWMRRGRPPANSPYETEYELAVGEMMAAGPRAVVGNVREHAVWHVGVPNPQPFLHEGLAFVHSGNIQDVEILEEVYLTDVYLQQHPPDYTAPKLDSELLFLYFLKLLHESPDTLAEAIHTAVVQLAPVTQDDRLDCLFTRGDTLFALRYAGADTTSPLRYYPAQGGSPFWVVASQETGDSLADWASVPPRSLGVFVAGQEPRFIPVGPEIGEGPSPAGGRATSGGPRAPLASVPLKTRIWGLVGAGYSQHLLQDQLLDADGFRSLGTAGTHGWGFASFADEVSVEAFELPVFYRGGPSAADPYDPDYDRAVEEIERMIPRAAIGHVRAASSGHPDVPDPHPFRHEGWVLVHNGTISTSYLLDYLENEEPQDFLTRHPPDYLSGHVDSELYLLYLIKFMQVHPELPRAEALRQAVAQLAEQASGDRLNFVMTAGDTLYALRYNDRGGVVYGPEDSVTPSPHWVVASEVLGALTAWHKLPRKTLGVFVPDEAPAFYPIHGDAPAFGFATVDVRKARDQDGDGWSPNIEVCCDPNVEYGTASVGVTVLGREAGHGWQHLSSTKAQTIVGDEVDTTFCPRFWVLPETLSARRWDLMLQLTSPSMPGTVLAQATAESHPGSGLGFLPVEGAARDTISDLAPAIRFTRVDVGDRIDLDLDDYASSLTLVWEARAERTDSADVYARAYWSDGMHVPSSRSSDTLRLYGNEADSIRMVIDVEPPHQRPVSWEFYLELFDASADTLADRATADDYPVLEAVLVEGAGHDIPDVPDTLTAAIFPARPNPARAEIVVPVRAPTGGARARVDIFDGQGRRVRALGPVWLETGESSLTWDGADDDGRALPAGFYYLDVRVGAARRILRCLWMRAREP